MMADQHLRQIAEAILVEPVANVEVVFMLECEQGDAMLDARRRQFDPVPLLCAFCVDWGLMPVGFGDAFGDCVGGQSFDPAFRARSC